MLVAVWGRALEFGRGLYRPRVARPLGSMNVLLVYVVETRYSLGCNNHPSYVLVGAPSLF